jgi:hypothetical protein
MIYRVTLLSFILTCLSIGCAHDRVNWVPEYPAVPRGEVVDDYHGTLVADPYRSLETPEAPETVAFVMRSPRVIWQP